MKEIEVSYTDETGALVRITKDDIVKYISTDESVTEKEVFMFLNMCKYLRLNPFLKEIYLVKYRGAPATFVVSYQTLLRRVSQDPSFDGYEVKIEGTIPDMTGTATVYRKDRSKPVVVSMKYSEAMKKTLDSTGRIVPTKMWQEMPGWMLRKVALARALKEVFPSAIGNAEVSVSEIVDIDTMDKTVIERRKNYKGDVNKDLYGIPDESMKAKPEEPKTEPNPEEVKTEEAKNQTES